MQLNVDERDMIEVPKQAILYYLFIFFITVTSDQRPSISPVKK